MPPRTARRAPLPPPQPKATLPVPVPCKVLLPGAVHSAVRYNPEKFFGELRAAIEAVYAQPLQAKLVDHSKTSRLFEACDVMRTDGYKLTITPQFMVCFYDLTVSEAMSALQLTSRAMHHLRMCCGLTRWPRCTLVNHRHPLLTIKAVRKERIECMRLALETQNDVMYDTLYRAHRFSGCNMKDFPGLRSERAATEAAPEEVLQEAPQAAPQQQQEEAQAAPLPEGAELDALFDDMDWDFILGGLGEEPPAAELSLEL